ncbi:MAG: glucosyltransferase domain-containing protein [Eubacteriales bacterium]
MTNRYVESSNQKYTFWITILVGLTTYLYLFTNNLNNYDNMEVTPEGVGTGLTSGRWFLMVVAKFIEVIWGGTYNVPLFNGLVTIVVLAVSSCVLIRVLEIGNPYLCSLIGVITVVYPTIAASMLFSYTVGYYAFAISFMVFGIAFIKYGKWYTLLAGAFFMCCSLGIYQGYLPYAIGIMVIVLMKMCMDERRSFQEIFYKGMQMVIALVVSYVMYRVILEVCLWMKGEQLSQYKGVDHMGVIDTTSIWEQITSIYHSMIWITYTNYASLSGTVMVRMGYVMMYALIIGSTCCLWKTKWKKKEERLKGCLFLLLLLLFPIAVNFMMIMVSEGIYVLMQLGFVTIFYLGIVVVDSLVNRTSSFETIWQKKRKEYILFLTVFTISVTGLNYAWQSNVNYRALYYSNRQVEHYYDLLYTRIKMSEGYSKEKRIYFIGTTIIDPTLHSPSWEYPFEYVGNTMTINDYSREKAIAHYLGYEYERISYALYETYESKIKSMNTYPDDFSILVIDDVVLVRLE